MTASKLWLAVAATLLLAICETFEAPPACAAGDCADPGAAPDRDPGIDRGCLDVPPVGAKLAADLGTLKTPETPAATVLGLGTSDVQRPSTPTGAALSIATGIAEGLVIPGRNFAADIAPYWLLSRPRLSASDLENETFAVRLLRTLSLSIATAGGRAADPGLAQTTDEGRVALGARTTLLDGRPSRAAELCMGVIDKYIGQLNDDRDRKKRDALAAWTAAHPVPRSTHGEDVRALRVRWMQDRDQVVAELGRTWMAALPPPPIAVSDCMDVRLHRVGPVVDVAFAAAWTVPQLTLDRVGETGARALTTWVTGGWVFSSGPPRPSHPTAYDISALVLVRQQWERQYALDRRTKRFDLGARGIVAWSRYGLSLEYLHLALARADAAGALHDSDRLSVTADYHLASGMWMTAVVGLDVSDPSRFDSLDGWKAILSVQGNFGRDRQIGAPDLSP